jgi:hypothetical protein
VGTWLSHGHYLCGPLDAPSDVTGVRLSFTSSDPSAGLGVAVFATRGLAEDGPVPTNHYMLGPQVAPPLGAPAAAATFVLPADVSPRTWSTTAVGGVHVDAGGYLALAVYALDAWTQVGNMAVWVERGETHELVRSQVVASTYPGSFVPRMQWVHIPDHLAFWSTTDYYEGSPLSLAAAECIQSTLTLSADQQRLVASDDGVYLVNLTCRVVRQPMQAGDSASVVMSLGGAVTNSVVYRGAEEHFNMQLSCVATTSASMELGPLTLTPDAGNTLIGIFFQGYMLRIG